MDDVKPMTPRVGRRAQDEVEEVVSTAPPSGAVTEVPGQVLMLQQELIQEVMSAMPGKCENCSANNPKIKHENDGQVCDAPSLLATTESRRGGSEPSHDARTCTSTPSPRENTAMGADPERVLLP